MYPLDGLDHDFIIDLKCLGAIRIRRINRWVIALVHAHHCGQGPMGDRRIVLICQNKRRIAE